MSPAHFFSSFKFFNRDSSSNFTSVIRLILYSFSNSCPFIAISFNSFTFTTFLPNIFRDSRSLLMGFSSTRGQYKRFSCRNRHSSLARISPSSHREMASLTPLLKPNLLISFSIEFPLAPNYLL
jgi:hypothetical protein